ncbi:hypothetical protein KDA23_01140 [Candidatus Saccharibacteria bacterium]|nr:hypothetical protein [Candidatus Saccharibacteria bacterium]
MATGSKKPKHGVKFGWRQLIVAALAILGIVSSVAFTAAHWTERQLLTTDNWITLVAPLPQNDRVATALSEYTVNNTFDTGQVEQRIRDGLPDRVAFLAPALTGQLQTRTTNLVKTFVQSDQFETVWVATNRAAHQHLLANARGETTDAGQKIATLQLKLGVVRERIRSLLGKADSGQQGNNIGISVSLGRSMGSVGRYVRMVDFLNATLWLVAIASFLGALVLSSARRRLCVIVGVVTAVVGLLQLIGVNALRPVVLNHIETLSYRPAIGVVYDSLVDNFRTISTNAVIAGTTIALVAYLTQRRFTAKSKTLTKQLQGLRQSNLAIQWQQGREMVRRYLAQSAGAVIAVGLFLSAFVLHTDWQGLVRVSLIMMIAVELLMLVAARPTRSAPM